MIPSLQAALVLCFSVFGGAILTFVWSDFLHAKLRVIPNGGAAALEEPRVPWVPILIGAVERALFTLMIAFSVEASGAFCGGWVTAKAITGMGPWNANSPQNRARVGVSMLGSGLSLLIGVACGLILRAWLRGGA
jgi:hypothetical protein